MQHLSKQLGKATKGSTKAMIKLGKIYTASGNIKEAKKWYLLAISKDDANADIKCRAYYELALLSSDQPELKKKYILLSSDVHQNGETLNDLGCETSDNEQA